MTDSLVIDVRNLSKRFCPDLRRSLRYAVYDTVLRMRRDVKERRPLRRGEFWALDSVSLQVGRGEGLAILGHNGAGKSTLLKLVYGLLQQDGGSIHTQGRMVGLLDLGAGIDPLLTGRENIVVSAMLHGRSRSEAMALIGLVLDFAELQEMADTVVQLYSTGMRARLGYAIAAQLRPDILIVDEALAVGDLAFQRKCIRHLEQFLAAGGALLLVSHVPHMIQKVCRQAVLLERGCMLASGPVEKVVQRYLESRPVHAVSGGVSGAEGAIRVTRLTLEHADGGPARCAEPALVRVGMDVTAPTRSYCGFSILSQDGWVSVASSFDREPRSFTPGRVMLTCAIRTMPLVPGRFLIRPIIADSIALKAFALGGPYGGGVMFDVIGKADLFTNAQLQMSQLVQIDACWHEPDV